MDEVVVVRTVLQRDAHQEDVPVFPCVVHDHGPMISNDHGVDVRRVGEAHSDHRVFYADEDEVDDFQV